MLSVHPPGLGKRDSPLLGRYVSHRSTPGNLGRESYQEHPKESMWSPRGPLEWMLLNVQDQEDKETGCDSRWAQQGTGISGRLTHGFIHPLTYQISCHSVMAPVLKSSCA